jgi:hypothetical protein
MVNDLADSILTTTERERERERERRRRFVVTVVVPYWGQPRN